MSMRLTVSLLAVLVACATGATAQTVAPDPNWKGAYIGVNVGSIGLNDGGDRFCTSTQFHNIGCGTSSPIQDTKVASHLFGGQLGYNYSLGRFVLGLETDFQRSWLSGVQVEQLITTFQPGVISNPFTYTASERLTWIGTTRARVGVPIGRTLVYGTGGLAYGRVELATSTTYNTFADYRGSESLIAKGWALGGGAEFLLTDHATVRAEAIHYDLGKITIDGRSPNLPQFTESREFQIRGTILRAALNYRF